MKIFLAGATGVVGQALVPLLTSQGHTVTGTTRSPAKLEMLRALGAEPVVTACAPPWPTPAPTPSSTR
jgi:2-alkyl-3-oxoalkanoate reductase